MRDPASRAQATRFWEEERREGEWVRGSEEVRRVARGVGMGIDEGVRMAPDGNASAGGMQGGGQGVPDVEGLEGKLRMSARMAVDSLKNGFAPSPHWVGPQPAGHQGQGQ